MSYRCQDIVWDYVRPSSSFINTGTYAPPSTPRVHAFAAVPRTEPADCKTQPPVGGIGTDVCRGRQNPYRGGLGSFHLRFTYLREGGHQVSRSPGPGSYETRHLTGGALVKRPKTASPCFRRPGGRLQFEGGGAWHEETPLVSAERRGTVRGSVKAQPQHYSLSFRSKADRLVVNKPTGTTHEGLGPGCYDVSKDGKSVGVKTEKRVVRGGCAGKGSTNQFLVDWRAYMKRPPRINDGYGDCGCAGNDGTSAEHGGKAERSPSYNTPETPQTVSFTLKSQSDRWPAARKRAPAAAGRGRKSGGPGLRLRESEQAPPPRAVPPQKHRHPEGEEEEPLFPRQRPQHRGDPPKGREKRPASAVASLRIPSTTEPLATLTRRSGLPRRRTISVGGGRSGLGSGLGGGSGDCNGSFAALSSTSSAGASWPPQFVPRPPSVEDTVSRPRTACSALAASRGIDSSEGRQGGGGRGAAEACAPRANIDVPLSKPAAVVHAFSGMNYSPAEAAHHPTRRLQPTAKPSRPEKADVAAGSEQPVRVIEDGAPRGASRLALPSQSQPTVRSEDLREEDSSGNNNTTTGTVASKPARGREGGEPTVRVEAEIPCSDVGHCPEKAAHTVVDVGRESIDQATTVPSSGPSPGASSRRNTPSPPPPRRRSDDSARNPSPPPPESRDSYSPPREDNEADAIRTSPLPFTTRTSSSGTAMVAATPASASTPPGQAAPEPPPLSRSKPENDTQASSTREASSSSSKGGSGEATMSAPIRRIQPKGSLASVLDVVERCSIAASRSSSRGGPGFLSDDQDARPRINSPGAGVPWNSNSGPRNKSEGHPFSAGLAEQQATLPRARYKTFQRELSLGAVPERPREDPSVARLAAATATQEIVRAALSVVVATRLSREVAGGGPGGGRALVSRMQ